MSVELLLSRLDAVEETRRGWRARCPAHEDWRPSLSIAVGAGDRILLHDFAGCRAEEVLAALGLTWRDLHQEHGAHHHHHRHDHQPPTDSIKGALVRILRAERRRRERLAFAFQMYRVADLVRALRDFSDEAQRLAGELGPEHPDTWRLVAIGAWAEVEALRLEMALESIDLRRAA